MPRVYVRKRQTNYTIEDVKNAVKDVIEKKKTYRKAAEDYGVPIKVIFDRIKGRKVDVNRMGAGVKQALPEKVERYIATCLKTRATIGHPCSKEELKLLVRDYVTKNHLKTPFKDNIPGDDWYTNFMSRNPELSLKKPEHLQKSRQDARKPYIVYDFYSMLKNVVDSNGLSDKPQYIFNCDESGFESDPSKLRGIGEKGKPLTRVSGGSGRESTTVLACVSADGNFLPPLIVFKGAAVQARWTSENVYPGTLYAATKNGWMEEPVFFNWLTTLFIPYVNKLRTENNQQNQSALLLYDGHSSHISVRICQEADQANIILMRFPSHLTDRIQPLDKCVFGPVKKAWDKKLVEHGVKQMGTGTGRLPRDKFGELLGEVYSVAFKSENIISGFTTTGLYPVDPSKFPKNLFKDEDLELYIQLNSLDDPEIVVTTSQNSLVQPSPNKTSVDDIESSLADDANKNNGSPVQDPVLDTIIIESEPIITPSSSHTIINESQLNSIPSSPTKTGVNSKNPEVILEQNTSPSISIPNSTQNDQYAEPSTSKQSNNNTTEDTNHEELINNILKLISLDSKASDAMKARIGSCFINAVTRDKQIKSPCKEQLNNIFGIKKQQKKVVIPRLKQSAFGEVLTSTEVMERLKKAEEEKKNKNVKKQVKTKKVKTLKTTAAKEGQPKNKKPKLARKEETSSSEEKDNKIDLEESSEGDNWFEECIEDSEVLRTDKPERGNFVLVSFRGGKRMTTQYKYLCIVESVDDEEMEIQVTSLKCIDDSKKLFLLNENDKSDVSFDDVLGICSEPQIVLRGARITYKFDKPIDVFEKA